MYHIHTSENLGVLPKVKCHVEIIFNDASRKDNNCSWRSI